MGDREFFDTLRKRALRYVQDAERQLDASGTGDGMMAPHVAIERVKKLRKLAAQIIALADVAETF